MPYQINLPDDELSDDVRLTPDQFTDKKQAENQQKAENEAKLEEAKSNKEEEDAPSIGTLADEIVLGVDNLLTDRDPEGDADRRARFFEAKQQLEDQQNPAQRVVSEINRAFVGSGEDLLEGGMNLLNRGLAESLDIGANIAEPIINAIPGLEFTDAMRPDPEPRKIDFNIIPENSTSWGDAARTVARYVRGSQLFGGSLSFGKTGAAGFATRFIEDFGGDFVAADETGEDTTLLGDAIGLFGSTPFSRAIQTSDEKHPLHNRALIGIDGALTSAGLFEVGKRVAPYLKDWVANQAARQADKTISTQGAKASKQLFDLLNQEYWDQSFDNGKSLEQNLIREGWRDNVIAEHIETASGGNQVLKQYLTDRTNAIVEADRIDDVFNTAKYGGDPFEEVVDGIELTGTFEELDKIDTTIEELQKAKATLSNQVEEVSSRLTQESTEAGRIPNQITELQARSMEARPLNDIRAEMTAIPFNLSARQVDFIQSLRKLTDDKGKRVHRFPKGITITPGRRIKGLNSGNIEEFLDIIRKGPDSDQRTRLIARFENAERPSFDEMGFETIESINKEVMLLKARQEAASNTAAQTRVELEPMNQQLAEVQGELAKQLLLREGIYSKFNGQHEEFLKRAEALKSGEDTSLKPEAVDEVVKRRTKPSPLQLEKRQWNLGRMRNSLSL